MKMTAFFNEPELDNAFKMRVPCKHCGSEVGEIRTTNGQDCVYCCCGKYAGYNAPKTETGRAVRSVSTVHEAIKPKLRSRILERATGRCELCGAKGDLHVGHIVSVEAGMRQGMTDREINSEENLCCMCA
jgi:hypothetical protein